MDEFIEEFKLEAGAIIENLQALLLSYDDSTSKSQLAEELFRGIHTLKGTSKMFSFDAIEEITHQLENILDDCRTNSKILTPELTDLCLKVLDHCGLILNNTSSNETHYQLLAAISTYLRTKDTNAIETTFTLHCILLKPSGDFFERGLNPLTIFNELKEMGDFACFQSNEKVILNAQIANKKIETDFELWLSSSKPFAEIEDVFLFLKTGEYDIISFQKESETEQIVKCLIDRRCKPLSKKQEKLKFEFIENHFQKNSLNSSTVSEVETTVALPEETVHENAAERVKLNYVNVAMPKLDQMMNLVSEFVTLSAEVKHYANSLGHAALGETAERLERFSTIFRDNAFGMRLVPIRILSVKLQRYVAELSQAMGKKVRFITEGMDTEIDKAIINQIEAPIMHIIRNAMDHGFEKTGERGAKGKPEECILKISAFHSGTNAFIHIQDDGAGIDLEKVQQKGIASGLVGKNDILSEKEIISLIFKPGFSTADKISEVSGRGVGMDIVRKTIDGLRGSIEVTTEKNLGTSFAIRLPLALSIMDVMIVRVGSFKYMFPHGEIELCTSEIFTDIVERKGFNIKYRNELLPFLQLDELFDSIPTDSSAGKSVLILNKNDNLLAIEVDEILGKEQVVIKPIDNALQMIPYLHGTSILGNGDLSFLIDVIKLKEMYARQKV
jgi:two-component system, chemotaxis family, sensor kinase CheA